MVPVWDRLRLRRPGVLVSEAAHRCGVPAIGATVSDGRPAGAKHRPAGMPRTSEATKRRSGRFALKEELWFQLFVF